MKYTEILKLKKMLEEANIPFTFTDDFFRVKELIKKDYSWKPFYPAYQIRLGDFADVVEHICSFGNEDDLLELMGATTEEESEKEGKYVLAWLTAEEVFKRFKYCWEHQTSVYKEEENND